MHVHTPISLQPLSGMLGCSASYMHPPPQKRVFKLGASTDWRTFSIPSLVLWHAKGTDVSGKMESLKILHPLAIIPRNLAPPLQFS